MQNHKIRLALGSLGSLSLVAVPLASVSFISNKKNNEEYQMSEKNFIIKESYEKPSLPFLNKDNDDVSFQDSNFKVSYIGSINQKPIFEIFSKITSLYYWYWENEWNSSILSKSDKENRTKLILEKLDKKVKTGIIDKTFTSYNDAIFFKIGRSNINNKNDINFKSSWGVPNSDTGYAEARDSINTSKIFYNLTKRTEEIYENPRTTKIYNEHLLLRDLYLLPVINVINPPIDEGNFNIQSGSTVEWNYVDPNNKLEMVLPPGSGKGSEWYAGLKQLIQPIKTLSGDLAKIILSQIIGNDFLVLVNVGITIWDIIKIIRQKDPSVGYASDADIQKVLKQSVSRHKNKINFGVGYLSSKDDFIDFNLKIKSYAMAKATSFFGNRTEADLEKVAGLFTNPTVEFNYKSFDYKDFK